MLTNLSSLVLYKNDTQEASALRFMEQLGVTAFLTEEKLLFQKTKFKRITRATISSLQN